jgi:hypothetical protein
VTQREIRCALFVFAAGGSLSTQTGLSRRRSEESTQSMSLFSWFSRKPEPIRHRPVVDPSVLLGADATVPLTPTRHFRPAAATPAPQYGADPKNDRVQRRELLYAVVRDAMVRAGVLSASYKFKVLSLDQRGRQFLVMIDVARQYGGETGRLSEIEALIAQTAKGRYDILVTAVYWRLNDHVAVGVPQRGANSQAGSSSPRRPPASAAPVPAAPGAVASPAARPLPAAESAMVAVHSEIAVQRPPLIAPSMPAASKFEPIEADEVAAFKRALAMAASASSAAGATAAAQPGVAVHSGPMLPSSFTPGSDGAPAAGADGPAQDLGATQYGDLN